MPFRLHFIGLILSGAKSVLTLQAKETINAGLIDNDLRGLSDGLEGLLRRHAWAVGIGIGIFCKYILPVEMLAKCLLLWVQLFEQKKKRHSVCWHIKKLQTLILKPGIKNQFPLMCREKPYFYPYPQFKWANNLFFSTFPLIHMCSFDILGRCCKVKQGKIKDKDWITTHWGEYQVIKI